MCKECGCETSETSENGTADNDDSTRGGRTGDTMTGFARDIRPLFRDKDVQAMKSRFDLSSYQDVKDNAEGILSTVTDGSMPCDQAWSDEQIAAVQAWISDDFPE